MFFSCSHQLLHHCWLMTRHSACTILCCKLIIRASLFRRKTTNSNWPTRFIKTELLMVTMCSQIIQLKICRAKWFYRPSGMRQGLSCNWQTADVVWWQESFNQQQTLNVAHLMVSSWCLSGSFSFKAIRRNSTSAAFSSAASSLVTASCKSFGGTKGYTNSIVNPFTG